MEKKISSWYGVIANTQILLLKKKMKIPPPSFDAREKSIRKNGRKKIQQIIPHLFVICSNTVIAFGNTVQTIEKISHFFTDIQRINIVSVFAFANIGYVALKIILFRVQVFPWTIQRCIY